MGCDVRYGSDIATLRDLQRVHTLPRRLLKGGLAERNYALQKDVNSLSRSSILLGELLLAQRLGHRLETAPRCSKRCCREDMSQVST